MTPIVNKRKEMRQETHGDKSSVSDEMERGEGGN